MQLGSKVADLDVSTEHLTQWPPDGRLGEKAAFIRLCQSARREHFPKFGSWLVALKGLLKCLLQTLLGAFKDSINRAIGVALDNFNPATINCGVARILAKAMHKGRKPFRKIYNLPICVAFDLHAQTCDSCFDDVAQFFFVHPRHQYLLATPADA